MSSTLAISRLSRFAMAVLGIAGAVTVSLATARPAEAAPYCQIVCRDSSSAACYERCQSNDYQKPKKIKIKIPPPEEPPVVKSVKQPDWITTVFEPKGGGGNGGGGNGR